MLRNNSDMPKTLKNKMVSGNPRPYSIYLLKKWILGYTYRNKKLDGEPPDFDAGDVPVKVVLHFRRI